MKPEQLPLNYFLLSKGFNFPKAQMIKEALKVHTAINNIAAVIFHNKDGIQVLLFFFLIVRYKKTQAGH